MGMDGKRGPPCAPAALFPVAFRSGGQRSIFAATAACTLLDPAAPVPEVRYTNDAACIERWMVEMPSPTLGPLAQQHQAAKAWHRRHEPALLQLKTVEGWAPEEQLPGIGLACVRDSAASERLAPRARGPGPAPVWATVCSSYLNPLSMDAPQEAYLSGVVA